MATITALHKGAQLLSKYTVGPSQKIHCRNNVLWAGPAANLVSAEDANTLRQLGWCLDIMRNQWMLYI